MGPKEKARNAEIERRMETVRAAGFDSRKPSRAAPRRTRPEKDDRKLHEERIVRERDPAFVEAERRKRREHIERRVNGKIVSNFVGSLEFRFPLRIEMGCGNRFVYETAEDFPLQDHKCPCDDPHCYFVEYPK